MTMVDKVFTQIIIILKQRKIMTWHTLCKLYNRLFHSWNIYEARCINFSRLQPQ